MNVLILSSEQLHPGNLHHSTFELSQARALQASKVEVAILSVYRMKMPSLVKALARSVLGKPGQNEYAARFSRKELTAHLLRPQTHSFVIRGIPVFEASGVLPEEHFEDAWADLASRAYRAYKQRFGKPTLLHAHS